MSASRSAVPRLAGLTTVLDEHVDFQLDHTLEALQSPLVWKRFMDQDHIEDQHIGDWVVEETGIQHRHVKGVQSILGYRVSMNTRHSLHKNDETGHIHYFMRTDINLFGLSTETEIVLHPSACKEKSRVKVAVKGSTMINGQVVAQSSKAYKNLPAFIQDFHSTQEGEVVFDNVKDAEIKDAQ
ncbi:hypothetical protein BC830DRAFT_1164892 [Chytriomyces sp. MP71]|nr:hypothetical protein BC830DRAFT_1164892 [Chytriomyces sp. MP71]